MKHVLACVVLALAAAAAGAIELVDVPLDHAAYEILERLEVRAAPGRTFLEARPLLRGQVAALVRRFEAAARRGDWRPTRVEAAELAWLRAEFSEELAAQGDSVPILQRAYHVWERPGWRLQGFWRGGQGFSRHAPEPGAPVQVDARWTFEPAAALQVGSEVVAVQQVSYRVRTGDGLIAHSTDVRDGEAEFVFDARDRFSITRTVAPYVRWARGRWRADLGRFRLRWGPGRHDAMLVLDQTPPFDQARLVADFGPLRFTHVLGQLRPARFPGDPPLGARYAALHRLDIAAGRRLALGVAEAVVWGDRGVDLAYVNPVNVFFVTQANIGDTDNALASVDFKLLLPGLRLYGECAVDDLNLRRGWRHFGNKVGVLAGLLWLGPLGAGDWDVEAEWSWASQFAYTHYRPIDRYQHHGGTLGGRLGPDAERLVLGLRRRLTRGWAVRAAYERERRGQGGIHIDHDDRTADEQAYLSGTVESRHMPGLDVRYRGLRRLDLGCDYRFVAITNPGHDAARARQDTHQLRIEARLEF